MTDDTPTPSDPQKETPVPEAKPDGQPVACCGGGAPPEEQKPGKLKSSRRQFMLYLAMILNAIAGVLFAIPVLGYILSSFRGQEPQAWIKLGKVQDFPEGQTRLASYTNPTTVPWDGKTADIPCWVRHVQGGDFQIFAINCTHLGCPVRWFQESRLFMCPCHGGVFYENGKHASGPPPRELYQYKHKIEKGELWIYGGQIPTLSNPV